MSNDNHRPWMNFPKEGMEQPYPSEGEGLGISFYMLDGEEGRKYPAILITTFAANICSIVTGAVMIPKVTLPPTVLKDLPVDPTALDITPDGPHNKILAELKRIAKKDSIWFIEDLLATLPDPPDPTPCSPISLLMTNQEDSFHMEKKVLDQMLTGILRGHTEMITPSEMKAVPPIIHQVFLSAKTILGVLYNNGTDALNWRDIAAIWTASMDELLEVINHTATTVSPKPTPKLVH